MAEIAGGDSTRFIAVDWGSSRLRVSGLDATGSAVRTTATDEGILSLDKAKQRTTLRSLLDPMIAAYPQAAIVGAGMIGSRNGMVETTPVALPATVTDVARAMLPVTVDSRIVMLVSPGLVDHSPAHDDLIRGEEVQIFGWLAGPSAADDAVLVLPGTHSKWVRVRGAAVERFRTFVTGELYARLLGMSSLCPAPDADGSGPAADADQFDRGARMGASHDGLLHDLFAARSHLLSDRLTGPQMAEFLSGLLIGYEVGEARQRGLLGAGERVSVIGDAGLAARYRRVLESAGIDATIESADVFGRGIAAIAAART